MRITLPSLTLSPNLTLSSCTLPANGAGTSIVALSDSSVTSESSAFTLSPGLTMMSITGMSLKSPMSGTFTSIALIVVLVVWSMHSKSGAAPRHHIVHGSRRSVSSPYFLMACSTTSALMTPSSASAFNAATVT